MKDDMERYDSGDEPGFLSRMGEVAVERSVMGVPVRWKRSDVLIVVLAILFTYTMGMFAQVFAFLFGVVFLLVGARRGKKSVF